MSKFVVNRLHEIESRGEEGLGQRLVDDGSSGEVEVCDDTFRTPPLALASIFMVLIAVTRINGEVDEPWQDRLAILGWSLWDLFFAEFVAKFVLAPNKSACLKRHPLDVLVLLVPFLRFLRLLRVLRVAWTLPVLRLLVFGDRGSGTALTILSASASTS